MPEETYSEPKCAICGKPLVAEEWIDDEKYGDAHTSCIRTREEEE